MKFSKNHLFSFMLLSCCGLWAETLYYNPQSTSDTTNRYGRLIYIAENWTNAFGVVTKPASGDVLVVTKNSQLTANPETSAVPLNGLWYQVNTICSQGTLLFQAGGLGMTNACSSGSYSWYCNVRFFGDGDVQFFVPNNVTHYCQRVFEQTDGLTATLVKRGGGTFGVTDSSA